MTSNIFKSNTGDTTSEQDDAFKKGERRRDAAAIQSDEPDLGFTLMLVEGHG